MPFSIRPLRSFPVGFASLITLLLLSSGPAYSGWEEIAYNESNTTTTYVDPDTIRRKGDLVKMWHMFDAKVAETFRYFTFLSIRGQDEYDCAEERTRRLTVSYHTGNMGQGKAVYGDSDVGKWVPVAPGTIGLALWAYACEKK